MQEKIMISIDGREIVATQGEHVKAKMLIWLPEEEMIAHFSGIMAELTDGEVELPNGTTIPGTLAIDVTPAE